VPTEEARRVTIAIISQPRNPEGVLWPRSELEDWVEGTKDWVVDETFREFSGQPSVAVRDRPGCWVSGTFTKFYAADDLRVGWVIAPEDEREEFGRFHGLLYDSLPSYSVAGALACWRARTRLRREVKAILRSNVAALRTGLPDANSPVGPVCFDRVPNTDGDTVARKCLTASVLVCPGSLFGDPTGVRICLTQRSFPRDFTAYLAVRRRLAGP
jgi:histidinol-phosphate/aromatic aminotransferase/cobyric acid decarboxylase-like protein